MPVLKIAVAYVYYKNYNFEKNEINKAKSRYKALCKQCQFHSGFDPGVQVGFDSFNVKGFQEIELIDITVDRGKGKGKEKGKGKYHVKIALFNC